MFSAFRKKFPYELGDLVTYKNSGGYKPMMIISYRPVCFEYLVGLRDEDGRFYCEYIGKLELVKDSGELK